MPLGHGRKNTKKNDKIRSNQNKISDDTDDGKSTKQRSETQRRQGPTVPTRFASLSLSANTKEAVSHAPSSTPAPPASATLPYVTATSPVFGRYLIAARDLKAGEPVISQQRPLVIGPCADPVCLGCYVAFDQPRAKQYKCPGCGWPLCGAQCPGQRKPLGHSSWECSALREKRVADRLEQCRGKDLQYAYEAIAPLRCLLLRQNDPTGGDWALLARMEPHNELRRASDALWQRNERVVVRRLRDEWGFGSEFSVEDVHTVCGLLEVNCFEIGQNAGRARALYDVAYLLAHDCSANTSHSDAPGTYEMTVRLVRDVPKGGAITLSYAYTLQGTLKRRDHLQECKFFWCRCARCADPTELGTHSSTIICPKCVRSGHITSTDPLDQTAGWRCNACGYQLAVASMLKLIDSVYHELDAIDGNDVNGFEQFLRKYKNVFHANHYLCVCAKHSLFQLYGRAEGYLIHELTMEQLGKKEQHCRDLLAVVDRLDPGLSKLRGVIMYELHAPIMLQATRQFEAKRIQARDLKLRLQEVVRLLRDSEQILSMEPLGTSEFEMSLAAADALQRIGVV